MKDAMAERLLARVLEWEPQDVARERPILQALAGLKYDEYQQFSPGMRFLESLALWLNQFSTADERGRAYDFVKTRLIFCSSAEMTHLVECAYPDFIRPILLRETAAEMNVNPRHLGFVARSKEFTVRQRQCLFLGLSDGARIDAFRRANRELNHEQIWQTHELAEDRIAELLEKLAQHVGNLQGAESAGCKFRTIVLLDDFSASGTSYYMPKPDGTTSGKVAKFYRGLTESGHPLSRLVDPKETQVLILLYMATQEAIDHIRASSERLWGSAGVRWSVEVVQVLPNEIRLTAQPPNRIADLINSYYDHEVFDKSMEKGRTLDARYGYAGGGLPLVLHHNTPNNSLVLLWSYDGLHLRGLFPRVQRHKEMS